MCLNSVSLKWNGFEYNMINNLKYAYTNECYSDVSLVCEGITIKAHKVVLSACSPLLQTIFAQNPHPYTVIILQDVSLFNLKALLTFIYNGEVNISQSHLSELLKAAENLKIRGLTTINEDDNVNNERQDDFINNETKQKDAQPEASNLGEIIPKEEPQDLICVEAILNEGYTEENNTPCDTFDQSYFMQSGSQTGEQNSNDLQDVTSKKKSVKAGKIKKKRLKKKHNVALKNTASSDRSDVEVGKENMITDDDIDKDSNMDNVLQSDIILEAFNSALVCEDETKNEQTKTNVENNGPKFPCPFCSRTYHTWGYRRRHVKSRHRVNRLTCRICEEQTTSQSSWFDHVVQQHSMGRAEARDSLVILVEAHAVLTCTSPPSPTYLLNDFQKERDIDEPLVY